jgi:hypothetical protein
MSTETEVKKHFKLPEPFFTNWLEALRSGGYDQGDEFLATEGVDEDDQYDGTYKYCCLGVAGAICKVPLPLMTGVPLLTPEEMSQDVSENYGIPKILTEQGTTAPLKYSLVEILTSLNDGNLAEKLYHTLEEYPGIWYPENILREIKEASKKRVSLDFKGIAEFLERNVEPIKETDDIA